MNSKSANTTVTMTGLPLLGIRKLYLIVLVLFLAFRLTGLGYDVANSDSIRWHNRSEKFLTALKQGDFKSTYQHYQPGVTLMWMNAIVKQVGFSYQLLSTDQPMTLENADYFPIIHGFSKAFLVLVLAALFSVQLYAIKTLFGHKVALIYGFLMAVEPYLIGIDRYFHLTSLETYSAFAAFLLLLVWLKKGQAKLLFFSALLLSFSIMSKITSLILGPILAGVFIYAFFTKDKKTTASLTALFFVVFIVFSILWLPAIWVAPLFVINKIYTAVTNAVGSDIRGEQFAGIYSHFFYIYVLILRLSPVTVVYLFATIASLVSTVAFKKAKISAFLKFVAFYLGFYYLILTLSDQKIDRYFVSFIPPLFLLISYFLSSFSRKFLHIGLITSFGYLIIATITLFPVYSAHYSPIIGGSQGALRSGFYDNSGEYYAQAAQYLNQKGRDINVLVPHNLDSFSHYYKGNIHDVKKVDTDYAVTSIDHLDDITDACSTLEQTFRGARAPVVFIMSCL